MTEEQRERLIGAVMDMEISADHPDTVSPSHMDAVDLIARLSTTLSEMTGLDPSRFTVGPLPELSPGQVRFDVKL